MGKLNIGASDERNEEYKNDYGQFSAKNYNSHGNSHSSGHYGSDLKKPSLSKNGNTFINNAKNIFGSPQNVRQIPQ